MGDLLRMVHEHSDSELVGICDEQPERMQAAAENFSVAPERVFTDYRECIEKGETRHRNTLPCHRGTCALD